MSRALNLAARYNSVRHVAIPRLVRLPFVCGGGVFACIVIKYVLWIDCGSGCRGDAASGAAASAASGFSAPILQLRLRRLLRCVLLCSDGNKQ